MLRVGGVRPVLLQTSVGGNYRGSIQMTNPSADRNPDAKVHPLDELVGRTIGIGRERLIGGDGYEERVRIVNHAALPASLPLELELGMDGPISSKCAGSPVRSAAGCCPSPWPTGVSRSATTAWTASST